MQRTIGLWRYFRVTSTESWEETWWNTSKTEFLIEPRTHPTQPPASLPPSEPVHLNNTTSWRHLVLNAHFLKLLIHRLQPAYLYAWKLISHLMRVLQINLLVLSGQTRLAWNIAWHRPQVWLFMAISATLRLICSTIPTTYWCKVKLKHVK